MVEKGRGVIQSAQRAWRGPAASVAVSGERGERLTEPVFVHESSVVEANARLGAGVKVWLHCHVRAGAQVGEGTQVGMGCYLASGAVVGARCRLQNHVSVYDGVVLEDDVFVGPSAVFTNVKTPRAHSPRRDAYEVTYVERGASIGANATVVCGVRIGRYAMVGAGAVVTRDVMPFALVVGSPARQVGWCCQCGERLDDERLAAEERVVCERCGASYQLNNDALHWLEERT